MAFQRDYRLKKMKEREKPCNAKAKEEEREAMQRN